NWASLRSSASAVLNRFPNDADAARFLSIAKSPPSVSAGTTPNTPEDYLNLSLALNRAGNYQGSIEAAQSALKLRPDYAEAYNNIAAAYQSMGMWDPAIDAAKHALQLKPDFQLARNNLAWSEAQKAK